MDNSFTDKKINCTTPKSKKNKKIHHHLIIKYQI